MSEANCYNLVGPSVCGRVSYRRGKMMLAIVLVMLSLPWILMRLTSVWVQGKRWMQRMCRECLTVVSGIDAKRKREYGKEKWEETR